MNGWTLSFLLCCVALIYIQIRNEAKLQYQQGVIEGMKIQTVRSAPQVNVTQTNENGGKLK